MLSSQNSPDSLHCKSVETLCCYPPKIVPILFIVKLWKRCVAILPKIVQIPIVVKVWKPCHAPSQNSPDSLQCKSVKTLSCSVILQNSPDSLPWKSVETLCCYPPKLVQILFTVKVRKPFVAILPKIVQIIFIIKVWKPCLAILLK